MDVDGIRYLDWVLLGGPLIFATRTRRTSGLLREAALRETSFGAPTEAEVELAAEIADAVRRSRRFASSPQARRRR